MRDGVLLLLGHLGVGHVAALRLEDGVPPKVRRAPRGDDGSARPPVEDLGGAVRRGAVW